jgi:hypothetical protein
MLIKILILFLAILSCTNQSRVNFFGKLQSELATTYNIKVLNEALINTGAVIKRPYEAWAPLLEFELLKPGFSSEKKCLFYFSSIKGPTSIRLTQSDSNSKCKDYDKDILVEEKFEEPLKIGLKTHSSSKLTFTVNDQVQEISLWNISQKQKKTYKKYDSYEKSHSRSNFLFLGEFREAKRTKTRSRGNYEDSFFLKKEQACHLVDDDCKEKLAYSCDSCRFGWYEVVGPGCKETLNKYCGQDRCGEKGEPACPRGRLWKTGLSEAKCLTGSEIGYCQPGLSTFCNENKILICL